MGRLNLSADASRGEMYAAIGPQFKTQMGRLYAEAGLDVNFECRITPTMDSHRVAWYAAEVDEQKGEAMWKVMSQRYFEGKGTSDKAVRLSDHDFLLSCAEQVGLDKQEVTQVLQSDRYRSEIEECVELMHRCGINSIPVLIFEVNGEAKGNVWSGNAPSEGRTVHNGSGSVKEFASILRRLHRTGAATGTGAAATAAGA